MVLADRPSPLPCAQISLLPTPQTMLSQSLSAEFRSRLCREGGEPTVGMSALRLETLLDKGISLDDGLILGCQRGEAWAVNQLNHLIKTTLTTTELKEVRRERAQQHSKAPRTLLVVLVTFPSCPRKEFSHLHTDGDDGGDDNRGVTDRGREHHV